MKWIVNTAWNHPKGMDWQEMQEELNEGMKSADPGMNVHCLKLIKPIKDLLQFSQVKKFGKICVLELKNTGKKKRMIRVSP